TNAKAVSDHENGRCWWSGGKTLKSERKGELERPS
ncbi:MAG: hypothetical protein ACI9OJ_002309, partial [Myxococcota bacterium]